ncbi:hypothetical protein DLAC_11577 [Tieghemostelium lacteum]|uniref:Uncharacterized protein n=1 Tax=Tieghemostelium lacteum TaxID=361077 RepID=A0A151ZSI0_TIELA|nr:hypothetical protein DLAC_11577 [Tieghemostelium lacteum]|eukprot:KYQ96890.1 hypothetical protein DLAC_11577 [Tieghemostelium lacteum]
MGENINNISIWVELDGEPTKPFIIEGKEYITQVIDSIFSHPILKHRVRSFNLVQVSTDAGVVTESGVLDNDRKLSTLDESYLKDNVAQIRLRIKSIKPLFEVRIFERSTGDDEPIYSFQAGVSWEIVKDTLHLSKGGLRIRNDPSKEIIIPPYPPGDYELVNSKSIVGIIL